MSMAFGASPLIVNPLSPALTSLGVIFGALWSPPQDAGGSAYKIAVAEEGLFRLDSAFLAGCGINPADINLETVRLYYLGEEVAIHVNDTDTAGSHTVQDISKHAPGE